MDRKKPSSICDISFLLNRQRRPTKKKDISFCDEMFPNKTHDAARRGKKRLNRTYCRWRCFKLVILSGRTPTLSRESLVFSTSRVSSWSSCLMAPRARSPRQHFPVTFKVRSEAGRSSNILGSRAHGVHSITWRARRFRSADRGAHPRGRALFHSVISSSVSACPRNELELVGHTTRLLLSFS